MKIQHHLTAAALAVGLLTIGQASVASLPGPLPEFQSQNQFSAAGSQDMQRVGGEYEPSSAVYFTGKATDTDASGYLFLFRGYDPSLARWNAADLSGFPDGANGSAYITNDPIRWVDPDGLAGTLVIHSASSGTSSSSTSGHSWVSFTPDGGGQTTYGTWGNDPTGQGNGLFTNLEQDFQSDVSRSTHLDDMQEQAFNDTVSDYQSKGDGGWSLTNPCSGFASEAWKNSTGEKLSDGWPVSTPTTLKNSIFKKNGDQNTGSLE